MESTSRAKDTQGSTYCFTTFSRPFSSGKQKLREYLGLPACKEGEPRKLYIKKMLKDGKVFPVLESPTQTEIRENTVGSQFSLSTLTAIDDLMNQAEKQLEDEKREEHLENQRREKHLTGQSRVWQLEDQRNVTELEDERQVVNPPGNYVKSNDIPSMANNEEIEKVTGPSKKKRHRNRKKKKKVKEVHMEHEGSCQIVEHTEACTQVNRQNSFADKPGTSKSNSPPKKSTREIIISDDILVDRQEPEWVPLADVILGGGCLHPEPADGDDDCVLLEVIQSPPANSKKRKGSPEEYEQQIPVKKIKPTCNVSEGRSQQDREKSPETVTCTDETNSQQHLKARIIDTSHTLEKNDHLDQGERSEAASHTSLYETESQQIQGKKIAYANCIPKSNSQHSGSIGSIASPPGDSHSRVLSPCNQDISSCTEAELISFSDHPRRSKKRQRKKTSITKLSLSKSQGSFVASTSRNNWRWSSHKRMKTGKQYVDVPSGEESSNTDIECCRTSVGKTQATILSSVDVCKSSLPHSLDTEQCFVDANKTCKEPDTTFACTVNESQEVLDTNILPSKEINSDQLHCNKVAVLRAPRKTFNLKRIGRIQNAGSVPDTSGSSCDPNSSSSVMEISSSFSSLTGSESITSVSVVEATPLPVPRKKGIITDPVDSLFCTQPQVISDWALQKNVCREKSVLWKKNEGKEVQNRDGKSKDRQLEANVQEEGNEGGDKCLMLHNEREESTAHPISSNSTQASDLSTLSSSSTEVLKPEGETCLRAVLQVFQEHFGGSKEDNLRLLQKNSFNLLTSLVEMQNLHPHPKKTPPTIDLDETGESSGG